MAKTTWLRLERSCRSETPSHFCKIPCGFARSLPRLSFSASGAGVPAQATLPPPTQNASLMLSCTLVLGWVSQTQRWQTAALGDIDIHEKCCEGPQPRHPVQHLWAPFHQEEESEDTSGATLQKDSFLMLWCWIETAGDRELHL